MPTPAAADVTLAVGGQNVLDVLSAAPQGLVDVLGSRYSLVTPGGCAEGTTTRASTTRGGAEREDYRSYCRSGAASPPSDGPRVDRSIGEATFEPGHGAPACFP